MLIRSGVLKSSEIPTLKLALRNHQRVGDIARLSKRHRDVLSKFYTATTNAALSTSQSFNATNNNMREDVLDEEAQPPAVLVLKRQAIRQFPDGSRVALYYSDKLNLKFSVPYSTGTLGKLAMDGIPAVREEVIEEKALYHPAVGDIVKPKRGGKYQGVVVKTDRGFVYFRHEGDRKLYKTHVNNVRQVEVDDRK